MSDLTPAERQHQQRIQERLDAHPELEQALTAPTPRPLPGGPLRPKDEQTAMTLFEVMRDAPHFGGCQYCSAEMDGCLRCKARAAVLAGFVQPPF